MNIVVLGGAGGMGGVFGAALQKAGHAVTLLDVAKPAVDRINRDGLRIERKDGSAESIAVAATTDPASIGDVDLIINFVKCYHTTPAVTSIEPLVRGNTMVLSLQNGWGNAQRIASILGEDRVLMGVTYHSATVVAPGEIRHAGQGKTFLGPLAPSPASLEQATRFVQILNDAGLEAVHADDVAREIWSKLMLNICTLPTSALLRFTADELAKHEGTLQLMRALLGEGVSVARAQGIAIDEDERWEAITGLLKRAVGARSSMLQDVEARRRTEIDVINGAIVAAGKQTGIATPYNQSMVSLIASLEATFP